MGYQVKACVENFGSSVRAMEEEVKKKSDEYAKMLLLGAIEFEDEGVNIICYTLFEYQYEIVSVEFFFFW